MVKHTYTTQLGGHKLVVESGEVAKQADAAVLVRFGDTTVLSAVVSKAAAGENDFFPLTINYEEKMYAAGKLPGGFIKREGKPSDGATLSARMIDRALRPLFPAGFKDEVQVTNTVFSVEEDCSPATAAMLGSSLALCISDIPFAGPAAVVQVGRIAGKFEIEPEQEKIAGSDLDLKVAGTSSAINMVEAGCQEMAEELMLDALEFGAAEIKRLCDWQAEISLEIGLAKKEFQIPEMDQSLVNEIEKMASDQLRTAILTEEKQEREENIAAIKELVYNHYAAQEELPEEKLDQVVEIMNDLERKIMRSLIIQDHLRPDRRRLDEIRSLDAKVDYIPRVHGSGLFTRGQTQVLSTVTLAPLSEGQVIDGLDAEQTKHFIHQYNFPQYSVGETGRMRAPGRREIGHGALGEKALAAIIPSVEDFPYTIRVVAEVLESNGSSSQASICAGTLALMAAGVPIKAPVAGIAMGLVKEGEQVAILTDIQGMEDHLGDMDFKVAGTRTGITALQMDLKVTGISRKILRAALEQAKKARLQILDVIESTIAQPRKELSPYAPKVETMQIAKDQIKIVIGKGGDTINKIIAETGVKIDIEEDGTVRIMSSQQAEINRTEEIIRLLTKKVKVGEVYEATVIRIEKFGAIVELFHGKEALVHISQLEANRVAQVSDVVTVGDKMKVKVTEVDMHDRIKASHRALIERAGNSGNIGHSGQNNNQNRNFDHRKQANQRNPRFVIKQQENK
ncbi:polyribonucleotide nucleotidyltransferase [Ligilactobacillus salitolerans]|uniref:Polyribonucleotide nucleotidyltransferase n=1 Tax=Ligilactobacillus salitolerans TaxID=1808352 RepID=A0A401IQV1_9LACO|nr:polyribonucleotide nucleotidyltransferase [Ligilactobacillus salitolerans]GBG93906.1 polyribonucleotide nucleotidyltransferase [Ligilactobacillus salitolerans]